MRSLLISAILSLSAGLSAGLVAQGRILVVDATGKASPLKTIMSAVKLAKSGDQIWIHPGDYKEGVVIDGKSLTLLGLGKKAIDVNISGVPMSFNVPTLTIRRVPKGGRFVVSRIGVASKPIFYFPDGLVVENSAGDIVIEEVESRVLSVISNVTGTVSIQHCKLSSMWPRPSSFPSWRSALEVNKVKLCLIQSSLITNGASGKDIRWSGLTAVQSTVEISNSSLQGGRGMKGIAGWVYPAGPGLLLINSTAFVRGRASDRIAGGVPVLFSGFPATGGDAIHLVNSRLTWSGVSLIPGMGRTNGKKIANKNSVVTQMTPALPLLTRAGPFAAGSRTSFQIQSQPGSVSVTWLTLRSRPLLTPVGYLISDLQTLLMPLATVHDAKGLGTQTLDLRNIARRHIGDAFVLQSLCMDKTWRLSLTNAQLNVIH